jgi:hypothetical protein
MNFPGTDFMMTNHLPGAPSQLSETPGDDWLDISAGAAHFCLRQPVQIHRQIISDYVEADATLGVNVIGAILSSLVWRGTRSGGESSEVITVALRRRADGQSVEVYLEVLPVRGHDGELLRGELLRLQFAGEQKSSAAVPHPAPAPCPQPPRRLSGKNGGGS